MKYTKIWANCFNEKNTVKWEMPKNEKWGKYVVDDSSFIPMAEQVKQVAKMQPTGNDTIKLIYDFEDGYDKGGKVPFTRTREGKGLAELSQFTHKNSEEVKKLKRNAVKEASAEVEREVKYQNALS